MSIPIALVAKKGSSSADVTIIPKESPDVTIVDEEALAVKGNLRDDPDAREVLGQRIKGYYEQGWQTLFHPDRTHVLSKECM
jgi:hypothetical protein